MSGWLVVAYHTKDALYTEHAGRLRASLDKFGLKYCIEAVDSRGKWVENCAYKPIFIRSMMDRHPNTDLLYVDVDAIFRRYPEMFDDFKGDFGVHFKDDEELLSGTLFFKATPKARALVEAWVQAQEKKTNVWDQRVLQRILDGQVAAGLKVVCLPPEYTKIFDSMRREAPNPVIEHFQASRRVRHARPGGQRVAELRHRLQVLRASRTERMTDMRQVTERIGDGKPNFEAKYPNAKSATLLANTLRGRPGIILGNSSSLNRMDLDLMRTFKTIGCNRILRLFSPDYYIVVDRDPYRQDLTLIRRFPGIRVLSSTIYNEKTICHRVPVQPIPEFDFYHFRAATTVGYPRNGHAGPLPIVQTDWSKPVPSAANIAFPMLQLAIMLGCNPIGIAGIDLAWKSVQDSHFFGNGSKEGCFVGADHTYGRRIHVFMKEAGRWCREHGIEIYNLSPEGELECFPRITEHEFHRRFSGDASRAILRDRKRPEHQPAGHERNVRRRAMHRHKPPAAPSRTAVSADFGQGRAPGGTRKDTDRSLRNAALQRALALRKARRMRSSRVVLGYRPAPGAVPIPPGPSGERLPILGEQRDLRGGGGGAAGGDGNPPGGGGPVLPEVGTDPLLRGRPDGGLQAEQSGPDSGNA